MRLRTISKARAQAGTNCKARKGRAFFRLSRHVGLRHAAFDGRGDLIATIEVHPVAAGVIMPTNDYFEASMTFQINGLAAETFAPLFKLPDAELAARGAVRVIADRNPGFPCRVSLCEAQAGEVLLLINYEHLSVASPYRSRHAIYVRENAGEARLGVGEIPEVLRTRLLSLRAFDDAGMMIDADVMRGSDLAVAIDRMFDSPRVKYLHAHNAKAGCFAARIERACA
jgi:hypothetical protein